MDKLQKNIRRVGGQLESSRRPHGDRLLLPSEVELCNLLGLSKEEYFEFVDKTSAYNGQRKEGYELIPDIKMMPEVFLVGGTWAGGLTAAGQIAVSVALTAIGYLLTPKPKPIKAGANVRGEDAIGSKRFAPQFAFNSLQELATLGDTVPLVFANQSTLVNGSGGVIGGIRVNGQLLWSQLLSLGRLQQLKAIALFSLGEIDGRPDFAGWSIGDLLLSTYSEKKLDLFFKSSPMNQFNRISKFNYGEGGDKYSDSEVVGMDLPYNDAFSDNWPVGNAPSVPGGVPNDQQIYAFSGTRNPTTQATFGLYSPMPNASVVKLPYELNYPTPKSSNEAKRAVLRKQKKTATFWPTRAGFTGGNVTAVDNDITYRILKSNQKYDEDPVTGTTPHGIEDVVSLVRSIREEIDAKISVGDTYMAGDGLIACTGVENIDNQAEEGTPWRPTTIIGGKEMYSGIERKYKFKVIEEGTDYDATGTPFKHPNLYSNAAQPLWVNPSDGGVEEDVNGRKIWTTQYMGDYSLIYGFAYRNPILQRAAIGTITNSRPCAMTEIGLKSKVFSSIRGTNINGVPNKEGLDQIYDDKVNFQLGNIDLYLKRYSFFKLQVREAGSNGNWNDLNNEVQSDHSGLFCVKGNTPEFQYNYIKITHPGAGSSINSQFEYRFKPYPGNNVALFHIDQKFNLLNATISKSGQREAEFATETDFGKFIITFAGRSDLVLTHDEVSNTEWILSYNTGKGGTTSGTGLVTELGTGSSSGSSGNSSSSSSSPVQVQVGPPPPEPDTEYNYNPVQGDENETLISLNRNWDGGTSWSWVVYKNGEEVGHQVTPAGTEATSLSIYGDELVNGQQEVYSTTSATADVTNNPINGSEVEYFNLTSKPTGINLSVGESTLWT